MDRTTGTGATNTRTTNTRTTSTLGRVRKLLARAERAGTPEEAQACTDKAVELMARHGIDMALLSAAEPGLDEVGATRMEVADPYSAGKARLLGWTASALRCRAVLHQLARRPGRRRHGVRVRLRPRAGRGAVHLAAPAGGRAAAAGAAAASGRVGGGVPAVVAARVRRAGAPAARRRRTPRRTAGRTAGRGAGGAAGGGAGRPVRRSCSPIGAAGSSAPTPRRSPLWAAAGGRCCRARVRGGRGRGRARRPGCRGPARAPRPGGVMLRPPAPADGRRPVTPCRPGSGPGATHRDHRRDRATRRRRPAADRGAATRRSSRRTASPRSGARA